MKPGTLRHGSLLLCLTCWIAFAGLALWLVSGGSDGFDRAGLLLLRGGPDLEPLGPGWVTAMMWTITEIGGAWVRLPLAAVVLAALLMRGRSHDALVVVALVAVPPLVNSLMKLAFARPRPALVPHFAEFGDLAFPSGHSFNAAATYIGLALLATAASPRWRAPALAAALILSLAVAFSRVWLGIHWPTDALAGWLGGAGWAALVWAFEPTVRWRR